MGQVGLRPPPPSLGDKTMFKQDCKRCGGKGIIAHYNHVIGGRCFSCRGAGYETVKTDPKILKARREQASVKRAAAKAISDAIHVEIAQKNRTELASYETDPRIGQKTLARCQEFPAVMWETCHNLRRIDSGTCPKWAADNLLRHITR